MWLHLTSKSLTWHPTLTLYEEQEAAMTNYSGHVVLMRCEGTHQQFGDKNAFLPDQ
jgi:hypothetical protein